MRKRFTTVAAAAALWAMVSLPAAAQSSGSEGAGSSQQSGSSSSGATDQQGSTHGDQVGSGGTGQSGQGQTGTSGQSGTGQSGTTAGSASGAGASEGRDPKASSQDRTFIMEAAAGGMAEVELGRLATQKASSADVKEFGQMMVDDHGKANDELKEVAQKVGVTPPSSLKPEHKGTRDRLSKLSGDAFDRAYMQEMVKDHQKDVALFRKHTSGGSSSEVRQFASSMLPTLEKHLDRAKEIHQTLGGNTPRGTSGSSEGAREEGSGTTPKTGIERPPQR